MGSSELRRNYNRVRIAVMRVMVVVVMANAQAPERGEDAAERERENAKRAIGSAI